jgi:Leucine-rich repeat (LRR) protein
MRRLATLAVVAALISPLTASGQDYSFGDWARDNGYSPGDRLYEEVWAYGAGIDSLDGMDQFDWCCTWGLDLGENQLSSIESGAFSGLGLGYLRLNNNQLTSIESGDFNGLYLHELGLVGNQLSSIESGAFSGLTDLGYLWLSSNQISSIESGTFSGLTDLVWLELQSNQISSIEPGDFSGLTNLGWLDLHSNQISSIESGDFSGLTNLVVLSLSGNQISSIEAGDFSELTNLEWLELHHNQISSIESGDFSGLTNLWDLGLDGNQISSIESGAFSGLTILSELGLGNNIAMTELNLAEADFSSLRDFEVGGNSNIASVSLKNTVLNQMSLAALLDGGGTHHIGIGELDGITQMDLSGMDFVNITDLSPLYLMDDLTDLWLVDTQNVDATALDVLLDNLETIEGADTEGVLYMAEADFDAFNTAGGGLLAAWNAEPGHHVEYLLLGDVNHDTEVNGLDVNPFVDVLLASRFDVAADMNLDGQVNGLDVDPFVAAVVGGGTQPVPEPSTLLLCIIAMGVVGGWRKWGV